MTIPDASCVIVGDTNVRTLTNKTITDSTNNVMASSLKSATTTVDVSAATAPSLNKVLNATNSTTASWLTPNHNNISNIGTNTHAVIDTFLNKFNIGTLTDKDILRYSSAIGNIINVQDLTTCESNIFNLQLSTGIVKTIASVAQNQVIPLTYTDNTDGNMLYVNNSSAVIQTPLTITQLSYVSSWSISGTKVVGNAGLTYTNTYARLNIKYSTSFSPSLIEFQINFTNSNAVTSTARFYVYGSNSDSAYTDTSTRITNVLILYSNTVTEASSTGTKLSETHVPDAP